jgi:hypothetical protein
MKNGQKLKLGDVTPRNIQEVQASKLGDAPEAPFFIGKNQVTFQDTIFLLLHALCVFLGASIFFQFFFFVCCNKWLDHIMFLLEDMNSLSICQERSSFHSYQKPSVLLFLLLLLVFVFALICI